MKNEELEIKLDDAVTTIDQIKLELDDLRMALDEITNKYSSYYEPNFDDLGKYLDGDTSNARGMQAFKFVCGYKEIMWLARTARMYCEEAQKLCYSVSALEKGE